MNTAVVNIKIDPRTKTDAQAVARKMGVSLSTLIKTYLREVVKTKTTTLSAREEPNPYFIKMLKKAREEVKRGDVVTFDSEESVITYLNDMIKDDKKRKKN